MNKLSLEELTEKQQSHLQSQLPPHYRLRDYIEDMNAFDRQINQLIDRGKIYVHEENYGVAGTTLSDASNLQTIYSVLANGQLNQAANLVDRLDTMVRDYLPQRLYKNLYCRL